MRKWILGAVVVAAGVAALAVVTKPGSGKRDGERALAPKAEGSGSDLASRNEKAKELSRRIAKERAGRQKLAKPVRTEPEGPAPVDEATKVVVEAMQKGPFTQTGFVPLDPAKHSKANDVVKSNEKLGSGSAPVERRKRAPDWGAVAPVTWERLTRLYTGFSIGRNVGGDFREEVVGELHGAAVEIEGAVMPIDPVGADGVLRRFWIARPDVVTAGCVFCKPPSLGDLVYVTATGAPMKVDREKLYGGVLIAKVVGSFELGPAKAKDGTEYLFGLALRRGK